MTQFQCYELVEKIKKSILPLWKGLFRRVCLLEVCFTRIMLASPTSPVSIGLVCPFVIFSFKSTGKIASCDSLFSTVHISSVIFASPPSWTQEFSMKIAGATFAVFFPIPLLACLLNWQPQTSTEVSFHIQQNQCEIPFCIFDNDNISKFLNDFYLHMDEKVLTN